MVICSCHRVTDKDVRRAVLDGARSTACLQARLNVSTSCGRCAPGVAAVLDKALAETRREPIAA